MKTYSTAKYPLEARYKIYVRIYKCSGKPRIAEAHNFNLEYYIQAKSSKN